MPNLDKKHYISATVRRVTPNRGAHRSQAVLCLMLLFQLVITIGTALSQTSTETGTLNIAVSLNAATILSADSAQTIGQIHSLAGIDKIVELSTNTVCSLEGFENRPDPSTGKPRFDLSQAISQLKGKKQPFENTFGRAKQLITETLDEANEWLRSNNEPILRTGAGPSYQLPNGRLYVSGLICIGLVQKQPIAKSAHFETDASGTIYPVDDPPNNLIEQGKGGLLSNALETGEWPSMMPPAQKPDWSTFQASWNAFTSLRLAGKNWTEMAPDQFLNLLSGIYWSTIQASCGEILPPVRVYIAKPDSTKLEKRTLTIPPYAFAQYCRVPHS